MYEYDRQAGLARDIECTTSVYEAAAAVVDLVDCRHVGQCADCLGSKDVNRENKMVKSGGPRHNKYKTKTRPKPPHRTYLKLVKLEASGPSPLSSALLHPERNDFLSTLSHRPHKMVCAMQLPSHARIHLLASAPPF